MLFETLPIREDLELKAASPDFAPLLWALVKVHRPYLENWMDWPQNLGSLTDATRYLREMHLFNQGQQHFFSFIFQQQQLVGSVALLKRDKVNRSAELAFWKHPSLLSKENMYLTCSTLIQYIWKQDFIQRLEIQTLSENHAAQKLTLSLGFQLEGRKRKALFRQETYHDLEFYGLLKNI